MRALLSSPLPAADLTKRDILRSLIDLLLLVYFAVYEKEERIGFCTKIIQRLRVPGINSWSRRKPGP